MKISYFFSPLSLSFLSFGQEPLAQHSPCINQVRRTGLGVHTSESGYLIPFSQHLELRFGFSNQRRVPL